jgi:branched-chain amino acid transport system substrate-binding protein
LRQEFERRAKELGVTPVTSQQIERGGKDFAPALQAVQASGAEAIFYAGSLPEAVIIVSQMKELGIKATFVGGDTLFQQDFTRQTGAASEGAYVSSFFPDISKSDTKTDQDWFAAYREEFKRNPGGNSTGGYVAAQAIIEAIKQSNSDAPEKIKQTIKSIDMPSFIGRIAFDKKGDLQDQTAHVRLFKVVNGEFVPVQP